MQVEFLKKIFSAHKTNTIKKQIYTFAAYENKSFTNAGRGIWKPSVLVLTMDLIIGCWLTIFIMGCPLYEAIIGDHVWKGLPKQESR